VDAECLGCWHVLRNADLDRPMKMLRVIWLVTAAVGLFPSIASAGNVNQHNEALVREDD